MMEGLVEDAKKYELQKLEKNRTMLLELSAFEILLNEVYEAHRPSPQDYDNRRDLIRIFNEIAREIHGNDDKCPVVKAFGSYLMDLFDGGCDLDLSINLHDKDENADRFAQVKTLRKFANKFSKLQKSRHVSNVELILSARVPVLKVTDNGSGVECDLSVGNLDGILKSQIVRMISDIDERFRKLSVLMKVWAKANNINSAKDGTINSLSFILLVAFHLQTRDIPILPPFSAILKDGLDPEAINKNTRDFLKYGESNKESLAELFVSMLIKLESVSSLWSSGLCASTYEGSWIFKQLGAVSIEDFVDRSQNTCRALKRKSKGTVFSCIRESINRIRQFTEQKIDAIELKNLLFQAKFKPKSEDSLKIKRKRKPFFERALRRREEKSRGLENTRTENIEAPVLSNIGRTGTSNVCSTSSGGIEKSRGFEKTHTAIIKALALSNVSRVGTSSVCSPSYGGIKKSLEIPLGVHNQRPFAANTFQGSGARRPEASLNYPAHQQIRMPNPPVVGYGGIRPDSPRGWSYHHTAPNFMPGHPLSAGYRTERSQVEHFGSAQNFPYPVNDLWSPRSSSLMSPHQPHFPPAPYIAPSMPAQFAQNSFALENRENSGHRPYEPRGNHPHLPFRRF
ncbi:hypothetical protein RND81_03G156400 [Saponaria officinalis]|uniref:Poly(A) RNA polymerase mitochondrial-like central palm domain-containing protein n=1 Tax=Saponaria officinalis TaxID=3572 RepID=A0AAW1M9I0_SAPOF